jgi:hypothetical protein
MDAVDNFFAETIIKVVMHLFDKFVVAERIKIEIAVGHWSLSFEKVGYAFPF